MSTTRLKIGGMRKLEKILLQYPAMADRATNWKPVGDEIHGVIVDDFKAMYKTKRNRPGTMQNLGPSLTEPNHSDHIWSMDKTSFMFGTSVSYSFWYMQWRKSQNRRSHIQFRARARRAVREVIMRYIVEGR